MKTPQVIEGLFSSHIHDEIKDFITNYSRYLPLPIDEIFQRRYVNDVPFFENIHQQLAPYASELFGQKVKPSYSFMSMYYNGGRCPLHIDRKQCRFTIDYLVQQSADATWPICISDELTDVERESIHPTEMSFLDNEPGMQDVIDGRSWTTVDLRPNDAVCYSGTHSWHYRPTILKGTADLVFFHFVPEDFVGSLK